MNGFIVAGLIFLISVFLVWIAGILAAFIKYDKLDDETIEMMCKGVALLTVVCLGLSVGLSIIGIIVAYL